MDCLGIQPGDICGDRQCDGEEEPHPVFQCEDPLESLDGGDPLPEEQLIDPGENPPKEEDGHFREVEEKCEEPDTFMEVPRCPVEIRVDDPGVVEEPETAPNLNDIDDAVNVTGEDDFTDIATNRDPEPDNLDPDRPVFDPKDVTERTGNIDLDPDGIDIPVGVEPDVEPARTGLLLLPRPTVAGGRTFDGRGAIPEHLHHPDKIPEANCDSFP